MWMLRLVLLLLVVGGHGMSMSSTKIVYCMALARSASTLLVRVMQARGDFVILHEPAGCAYNMLHRPEIVDEVFLPTAPRCYAEVYQAVMESPESRCVFIKEMCPTAEEFLATCPTFLQDPRVYVVFLVRDPHGLMVSNYLVRRNAPALSKDDLRDRLSYERLYRVFMEVSVAAPERTKIISMDDFCADPAKEMQAFCAWIQEPMLLEKLQWDPLQVEQTAAHWHVTTNVANITNWHGAVLQSTHVHELTRYKSDAAGSPTFEEVDAEEWRQFYQELYVANMPWYERLVEVASARCSSLGN